MMFSEKFVLSSNNLTFDVGGMGIKVIEFNQQLKIIKEDYLTYQGFEKAAAIDLVYLLDLICDYITKFNQKVNVGICWPGIIDVNNYLMLSESFIHHFQNLKIDEYLLKKCHNIHLLLIENDAKAAALGELNFGFAKKYRDCMMVTVGSGVGGALILNSKLRNGSHYLAGEISKIYANLEESTDRVLVHAGSTMALQFKYAKLTGENLNSISGKEIMEQCAKNNKKAIQALKEVTNALARALFNLFTIVDVEAFLIGGGISASDLFIEQLKNDFQHFLTQQQLQSFAPELVKCRLENKAGCYGMLDKILKEEEYEKEKRKNQ